MGHFQIMIKNDLPLTTGKTGLEVPHPHFLADLDVFVYCDSRMFHIVGSCNDLWTEIES